MNEYFKTKNSDNHCTIVNAIYHKVSILYDEVYPKVTAILFARILHLISQMVKFLFVLVVDYVIIEAPIVKPQHGTNLEI